MAGPTIVQVMDAIEAQVKLASTGLTFNEEIGDDMPTPAAFVELPDVGNYRETFGPGGKIKYEPITLTVLVEKQISRVGLRQLALLASPTGAQSVLQAVEVRDGNGDRSLGGVVEDCIVLSFRMLSSQEVGAYGYVGGVFNLRVIAAGI